MSEQHNAYISGAEWYEALEDKSTATFGNFMKALLAEIQKTFSQAEYAEIQISGSMMYPVIKLPWLDGSVGEEYYPVVIIKKNKDDLVTAGTMVFEIGVASSTKAETKNIGIRHVNATGAGASGTHGNSYINRSNYRFMFNVCKDSIDIAWVVGDTTLLSWYILPCAFVCRLKNAVTKKEENAVVISSQGTEYIYANIAGEQIPVYSIRTPQYANDANIVIAEKLIFGRYYSDVFYRVFPSAHAMVAALCKTMDDSSGWSKGVLNIAERKLHVQLVSENSPTALAREGMS